MITALIFFCKGIITTLVKSDGHMLFTYISLHSSTNSFVPFVPSTFQNSANMPSGPIALPTFSASIEALKVGKAIGPDGMLAEFWKVLGTKGTKELVELCKEMYVKSIWPSDFTRVVMIPLQKKINAVECSNHRTISLISHASKILIKILTNRIEAKAKDFIGRNQFGFRKGCGTSDAIGVMRMICERSPEFGNNVYICFVDFEKAFDRVNWEKMMKVLQSVGVD